MKYKPEKEALMDYLYGELEGEEKLKVEKYLAENASAKKELEELGQVRQVLGKLGDQEVIAPPIFMDQGRRTFHWNSPFIRYMMVAAASFLIVLLAGKFTGARLAVKDNSFSLSFGEVAEDNVQSQPVQYESVSMEEVQSMINDAIRSSNQSMMVNWDEKEQHLFAGIQDRIKQAQLNHDVTPTTVAIDDEQIRGYISTLQAQQAELMKDYFKNTTAEQNKYMEELLIDFAKYLQQQRTSDIQLLQTRISSIEKNNDVFKQETEQILSSIIASPTTVRTVKN